MNSDKKLFEIYRDEFPVTKDYVYLDHAGVAPVSLRGKRAVEKFLSEATESGMFNYKQWMDRVEVVGRLCKGKGILFFVDAIQSLGVIPMDVNEFKIDFLAADGHKWLLSPEGTGIFYCRKELATRINPPL